MTSGTHALILAQSAFEAVCKERDEALAKLSTVNRWVEKNLSSGFIDSLTHLQNLECLAYDWHGRLVETIRERDEAREQLQAMREAIKDAHYALDYVYNDGAGSCAFPYRTDDDLCSENRFHHVKDALDALKPLLND